MGIFFLMIWSFLVSWEDFPGPCLVRVVYLEIAKSMYPCSIKEVN